MKHITFSSNPTFHLALVCCMILFMHSQLLAQTTFKGTISWENSKPYLSDAVVLLTLVDPGNQQILGTLTIPVTDGVFNEQIPDIINPLMDFEVQISVSDDVSPREGVTILDLIRMQKHLLNILPFTNALQLYAADTNNSFSVSALDLVEMRKIILGQIQTWNKNNIYFFVRTSTQPPSIGTILETKATFNGNALPSVIEVNFWVVKTGDVTR